MDAVIKVVLNGMAKSINVKDHGVCCIIIVIIIM